ATGSASPAPPARRRDQRNAPARTPSRKMCGARKLDSRSRYKSCILSRLACQNGRDVRQICPTAGAKERPRMAETRGPGLYDPRNEHDSCGVGFVVNIKGRKSHDIIRRGLQILVNLDHRGAVGADPLVGDGAGCMIQIPDALLRQWTEERGFDLP